MKPIYKLIFFIIVAGFSYLLLTYQNYYLWLASAIAAFCLAFEETVLMIKEKYKEGNLEEEDFIEIGK